MMNLDLRSLAINVGLAALAAFTGAIIATDGAITQSVVIAGGYAAVRAAAGALYEFASSRRSG